MRQQGRLYTQAVELVGDQKAATLHLTLKAALAAFSTVHAILATAGAAIQTAENTLLRGSALWPRICKHASNLRLEYDV